MPSFSRLLAGGLALLAAGTPALAAGTFPITLEQELGPITIEEEPRRIVALIDRDVDTLLALGVEPVAIRSNFGFESGVGPWAESLLMGTPTVWTGRELDYEAIAAQRPDLIVFTFAGGAQEEYDVLSAIAPTVYLPSGAGPWQTTMEETTLAIAEALGRRADGEALLADFDLAIEAERAAHPEFAGRTANYMDIFPGGIWSYAEDHAINQLLYRLGFSPIALTAEVPPGAANVDVSPEIVPDYEADIVVIFPYDRTLAELTSETPTLALLPAVAEDRVILLEDLALSASSILSLPYAIERLAPLMAEALER